MAGKSENILVEFDYNNIAIIDPNKVIDETGRAKERLVNHEDLVMYANLECKVIPRTKLVLGASNSDNLRTISVSSMNFLNPGDKTFIDNAYTDELTGKDTLKGEGVNQQKIERLTVPNKTNQFFYNQSTKSKKEPKATDNGLLGIKSISIKQGMDFEPVVNIKLEDVKGRALFESGNDSPYSAFFNLPYPLFYLTIKGYYGKAVRLPLMLQDFVSSYNSGTGNFEIDLTLYSYKYSVLAEVAMGSLIATPHMYRSNIQVTPKTITGGLSNITQPKTTSKTQVVEYGTQKIKEVYSEYKSKGLIPDDFPELTVVQMQKRLDQFIQKILDEYSKQNLDSLTNLTRYESKLNEYQLEVYYKSNGTDNLSWFNKYMDTKNYFVVKQGLFGQKMKVYTFSPEFSANTQAPISELKSLIDFYNNELNSNETCGTNGSYEVNGKTVPCEISNPINYNLFEYAGPLTSEDIDFEETFRQQKGTEPQNENDINELKLNFDKIDKTQATSIVKIDGEPTKVVNYFKFEGKKTFINETDKMLKEKKTKQDEIETALTNALAEFIKSKDSGLGFVPTIRNVLAVIFANGEAFLRLLDEVHTKAWTQRNNPNRKKAIFSVGANPDATKQGENAKVPIYPWPEYFVETSGENGEEKYVYKYPGDTEILSQTRGSDFEAWPEVEFVEEYTRGLTIKTEAAEEFPSNNQVTDSKRLSLNAIEYPTNNEIYSNKEETKFFFEIYERLMLSSFYSKMSRTVVNNGELARISQAAGEIETTNILQSIASENPFLKEKLANYDFNSSNYLQLLKQFSNQGVGVSWQNFERGIFNTPYIKNLVQNNSFSINKLNSPNIIQIIGSLIDGFDVTPTISSEKEEDIQSYITGSTNSNKVDFTDTFPFTNISWNRKYLAGNNPIPPQLVGFLNIPNPLTPAKQFYDTTKNLFYNTNYKVIANFSGTTDWFSLTGSEPRPFSSYNFKKLQMPSGSPQNSSKPELNTSELNEFYSKRNLNYKIQLPTEGSLNYSSKPGLLTKYQTTSILNTPYFTNSIQEGVKKFRNFDEYPYKVPAYLFINSLPLSTLREKYTSYSKTTPPNSQEEQENVEYLNYIFMTLKKYGAVHKLPYPWILKIGSVWHRYKVWAETGVDILDNSWDSFKYVENFDPITSASTTDYALTLQNGQNVDIILEKTSTIGSQNFTQMSTGFYPETINEFNVFYQGYKLFTGYTSPDIQVGITSGLTLINSSTANVTMGFSGDPLNPNDFIQLNAWSAYVTTLDKKYCYLLPSHGSNINQVNDECFQNGIKKIEIVGNQSVFDGSVRSYWNAPNYGYFDVSRLVKPKPDEYMKKVFGGFKFQENFSIHGTQMEYTKMSEIFSVFEKEILDVFENSFLSFCRPKYNYVDVNVNASETENSYGNFQLFLTSLMKVPAPNTGLTPTQIINNLQESQTKNFSNLINGFMNYDVLMKYGNPSNFDKQLFYSFSNKPIVDQLVFEKYTVTTPNALPSSGGTQTLVGSKLAYPDAWKTLLQYVGFSEIQNIEYTNTGSTIFDFFIDFNIAFTPENIKNCSPIIKIYATQKSENLNLNASQFLSLMDKYLDDNVKFIDKSLNDLFPRLQKQLDGVKITKDTKIDTTAKAPQAKLELYQSFKATNDKWISGCDFKNKTLFEDIYLLDRASRNIGDKVVVDIYKLKELLDPSLLNPQTNMMIIVRTILSQNNFQVMNVPSYVNFYNVQDATKNAVPKPEGSLEMANTLFGTFTNVDYRNSSTKMVCFYAGKPSTQLDTQGIIDGWKNDSFDLRRASDNPLVESQINKRDWDKSNKVVGFNVDIGPQNQGIFTTFSVSQKNSTPTAESLKILSEMSRQAGNRNVATQNLSLYNLYKLRSYDCNVTMMGNALIQPTMYFNLRYVPMFAGPYLITEVSHQISPGQFITSFTGVRQAIANYETNLDFIQSLRTNLVQKIIQKKKEQIDKQNSGGSNNSINDKNMMVNNSLGSNEPSNNSECSGITKYESYTKVKGEPKQTTATAKQVKDAIMQVGQNLNLTNTVMSKLKYAVFAQMYLQGGNNTTFAGLENNYIGIDLTTNWGNSDTYFGKPNQFFCVKRKDELLPYVTFDSVEKNIEFLLSRWRLKSALIAEVTPENIASFINTNKKPNTSPSTWFSLTKTDKDNIIAKVKESISLFDATN